MKEVQVHAVALGPIGEEHRRIEAAEREPVPAGHPGRSCEEGDGERQDEEDAGAEAFLSVLAKRIMDDFVVARRYLPP